ncbi:MAG TPA: ABC transporter permease [Xanthobacteraceae bacterium]|nr:ABC transporter permease [Xanthobacteraceae bacterium]
MIGALMLRDMRTRFGRTFFGYLVIVGWPLSHLLMLMVIYTLTRSVIPIGTNASVFFATGVLPYILCLYPSRMTLMSLVQNYPLLYFPIVKSLDVVLARGLLEIITAFWVTAIFCFLLVLFGIDIMPIHLEEALLAVFATIYLAFSLGFFGALIYKVFRPWQIVHIIAMIVMYFCSGALFLPSALPDTVQYYIWFNPLLHSVEWLRSAYYDGYSYGLLSKPYLLGVSTAFLMAGLIAERSMRGIILQA